MSDPAPFFRREALEFRTARRDGGVLRTASPWPDRLYWLVLALVTAGLGMGYVTHVAVTIEGPALVDAGTGSFRAFLPMAAADMPSDFPVTLHLDEPVSRRLHGQTIGSAVVDAGAAQRAGLHEWRDAGVLVRGPLIGDADDVVTTTSSRLEGRAVVQVDRERLLGVFARGFQQMLGHGDDR